MSPNDFLISRLRGLGNEGFPVCLEAASTITAQAAEIARLRAALDELHRESGLKWSPKQ